MNRITGLILLFFVSIYSNATAQFKGEEFHKSTCWIGIDFSHSKMVGSAKFGDPERVQSYYFKEWNNVPVYEMRKYNFSKHYKIADLTYRKDVTDSVNVKCDFRTLFTETATTDFTSEQLQEFVNAYDLSKVDKKYALTYVVQEFNSFTGKATIWITVVEVATKKVVKSAKFVAPAAGGGFRNYWLGSVFETLLQSRKTVAKDWN